MEPQTQIQSTQHLMSFSPVAVLGGNRDRSAAVPHCWLPIEPLGAMAISRAVSASLGSSGANHAGGTAHGENPEEAGGAGALVPDMVAPHPELVESEGATDSEHGSAHDIYELLPGYIGELESVMYCLGAWTMPESKFTRELIAETESLGVCAAQTYSKFAAMAEGTLDPENEPMFRGCELEVSEILERYNSLKEPVQNILDAAKGENSDTSEATECAKRLRRTASDE